MKQTIIVLAFLAVPFTSSAALIPADITAPTIVQTLVSVPQENGGGDPVTPAKASSFGGENGERSGCLTYWPGTQIHTPCYYDVQAAMILLAGLNK